MFNSQNKLLEQRRADDPKFRAENDAWRKSFKQTSLSLSGRIGGRRKNSKKNKNKNKTKNQSVRVLENRT